MNRDNFLLTAKERNISPESFNINGDGDECYSLLNNNNTWNVIYKERGIDRIIQSFSSESSALEFLLKTLDDDPTTKLGKFSANYSSPKRVVVIGYWVDIGNSNIVLQSVILDGLQVFPLFTSIEKFKEHIIGSGMEENGIEIDLNLLVSIINKNDTFVINPGDEFPIKFSASELADYIK